MPVVAMTRLRVRSWRYLPPFFVWTLRAALQTRSANGCLAVSVLAEARRTFWTRTVWTEEASMRAYIRTGEHRQVMPRLLEWCDEASVAQWTQEATKLSRPAHVKMRRA
jgi:hypothetical protein